MWALGDAMSGVKIVVRTEVSAALMDTFMSTKRTSMAISMIEPYHGVQVCICTYMLKQVLNKSCWTPPIIKFPIFGIDTKYVPAEEDSCILQSF